jgi:phosphoglycerate dehydrogenase-like enzyme
MNVLLAVRSHWHGKVFSPVDLGRLSQLATVIAAPVPEVVTPAFLHEHLPDADVLVTSWDTPRIDEAELACAPRLSLVLHAAGSVKPIVSDALWRRGIRVSSSASAIGIGVAEFCLGMLILAPKRAFWGGLHTRQGLWREPGGIDAFHGPMEIYQQDVGVIGAGFVGRRLIRLLQPMGCRVRVYDPYLSEQQATDLGATKVQTLEDLFSTCTAVSLNAPSTEQTRHMIRRRHLDLLPDGAVFINTSRGNIVHEGELVEALRGGRFVACIDVTDGEPPAPDHPLRALPNVWLTPHEAGAVAHNLRRLGTLVADELQSFLRDRTLAHEVRLEQLATIA